MYNVYNVYYDSINMHNIKTKTIILKVLRFFILGILL